MLVYRAIVRRRMRDGPTIAVNVSLRGIDSHACDGCTGICAGRIDCGSVGAAATGRAAARGAERLPVSRWEARTYRLGTAVPRPSNAGVYCGANDAAAGGGMVPLSCTVAGVLPVVSGATSTVTGAGFSAVSAGVFLVAFARVFFLPFALATRALRSLQPHDETSLRTLLTVAAVASGILSSVVELNSCFQPVC